MCARNNKLGVKLQPVGSHHNIPLSFDVLIIFHSFHKQELSFTCVSFSLIATTDDQVGISDIKEKGAFFFLFDFLLFSILSPEYASHFTNFLYEFSAQNPKLIVILGHCT